MFVVFNSLGGQDLVPRQDQIKDTFSLCDYSAISKKTNGLDLVENALF